MHGQTSKTTRALTWQEIVTVVAVVSILVAIAIPQLINARIRSQVAQVQDDLKSLQMVIENYMVDNAAPPRYNNSDDYITTEELLVTFVPHRLTTPHT
jgi:Tfp pilus assembly protein PilE